MYVGVAVHKGNVGHAPGVQGPDVPRDGHHPRLVEEAKPHHWRRTRALTEASNSRSSIWKYYAMALDIELSRWLEFYIHLSLWEHINDAGEDLDEESWLLMLDNREADDMDGGWHQVNVHQDQVEHHKIERSNLKNVSHFRELPLKTQRILLRSLTFQSVQSIVSPALEMVDVRIDKLEGGQGQPVYSV